MVSLVHSARTPESRYALFDPRSKKKIIIKVRPVRQIKPIKIYNPPKWYPGLPSPDSATNKLSVGRINILFFVGDMNKESLYTYGAVWVAARCGARLCSTGHV